ncbi:hypothetical protein DFR40_2359 [Azonexus fungiphilus]|uniref:PRTase-CE domain-containing protein n=1 Tax=Azonexus fungiphilus TaxID=146940 RepID=A0A495VR63_9RHOO|nr:hypothetical protein [Azonexus fungiphilus]RKT51147.1 hypothetical protein DFR40_2359 [Azonexus fungiphilus]
MHEPSTIVAEKISYEALTDLMEVWEAQPWTKEYHRELTELWNICEKRDEQNLLKNLLKKFFLLDAAKEKSATEGVSSVISEWGLNPESTWIVAVANKEEIDGSTAGLQKLKNKLVPMEKWHSRCISNIPAASEKIRNGDFIVLFDDFIGTGGKMLAKTNWLKRLLAPSGVTETVFYYTAFSAMTFGIKNLSQQTSSKIYSHFNLRKAISDEYPPAEASYLIDVMKRIESKLGETYKKKKISDYSLGYGSSEALYCAQNDNCPNNVFPILWWRNLKNGKEFNTLLKRAG